MNWSCASGPAPMTISAYATTSEIAMPIGSDHRWSSWNRAGRVPDTAVVIGGSPSGRWLVGGSPRVGGGPGPRHGGPALLVSARLLDGVGREVALLEELPVLRRRVELVVRDR